MFTWADMKAWHLQVGRFGRQACTISALARPPYHFSVNAGVFLASRPGALVRLPTISSPSQEDAIALLRMTRGCAGLMPNGSL